MKKNRMVLLLFVLIILMNVLFTSITNSLIHNAFRPYEGIVIVLDAGHGGKDMGTQYGNIKESELNFIYVKKIKKRLENLGVKVVLTRKDDNDLASVNADNRKKEDLKERMKIINNDKVDFYISVHMNSYLDENVKGSQIFYSSEDSESYNFAKCINEKIIKVSESDKQIKANDVYYVLKNTKKVGILLECGFLSNEVDRYNIINDNYQNQFCGKVVEGIMDYLNMIYQ